jgi:hypothetical protein
VPDAGEKPVTKESEFETPEEMALRLKLIEVRARREENKLSQSTRVAAEAKGMWLVSRGIDLAQQEHEIVKKIEALENEP